MSKIDFQPIPKRFMVWDKETFTGDWCFSKPKTLPEILEWFRKSGFEEERYIICQSTNLFDEDGKEIFEGSIIHGAMSKWLVRQIGGCWAAQNMSIKKKFGDDYFMMPKNLPDIELLGHILSTPELLEEK